MLLILIAAVVVVTLVVVALIVGVVTATRCGFEAFATVEEAIEAAEAELGSTADITLLQRPPQFIPRVSAR